MRETHEVSESLQSVLVLEPGATCLDAADLIEQVAAWLGTRRVPRGIRVRVRGSSEFARHVTFRIRAGDGRVSERSFAPGPADCNRLHAVVGLALAISVRASLVAELTGGQRPSERDWEWGVAATPLVVYGVVPGWGLGAEGTVERALSSVFSLRVGGTALHGPRSTFSVYDGAGYFDVSILAGRADACASLEFSRWWRGRACQGLARGVLRARGHGFRRDKTSVVPFFALTNGFQLGLKLSDSWWLEAGVESVVPFEDTSIVLENASGEVVDSIDLAPAGVVGRIGPALRF